MTVRAKFTCNKIERTLGQRRIRTPEGEYVKGPNGYPQSEPCEVWTVCMNPVYANNDPHHENSQFWDASPSGSFILGTVNADAVAYFELGKEYYIDLTKCEVSK